MNNEIFSKVTIGAGAKCRPKPSVAMKNVGSIISSGLVGLGSAAS